MEEAKAAILGYGAATTIEGRRTLRNAQKSFGDLEVEPCAIVLGGGERSTRLARTALEERPARGGKDAENHLLISRLQCISLHQSLLNRRSIAAPPFSWSIFPMRSECSLCRRMYSRDSTCHGAHLCFIERDTRCQQRPRRTVNSAPSGDMQPISVRSHADLRHGNDLERTWTKPHPAPTLC